MDFVRYEEVIPDSIIWRIKNHERLRVIVSFKSPAFTQNGPIEMAYNSQDEPMLFLGLDPLPPDPPTAESNIRILNPGNLEELQMHKVSWDIDNTPGISTVFGVNDISTSEIVLPPDTTDGTNFTVSLPDTFFVPFNFQFWAYSWDKFTGLASDTVFVAAKKENFPEDFILYQNYPNPFNTDTTIEYDLPENSYVELIIYNILGQRMRTLVDEEQKARSHSIIWEGLDDAGQTIATGIYIYKLQAGSFVDIKKMLLIH